MRPEQWLILAIAVLAVVALVAVLVLAASLRRLRGQVLSAQETAAPTPSAAENTRPADERVPVVTSLARSDQVGIDSIGADESFVITSDGRTIVLPSTEQVVTATLGRPMIRGAVLSHGILHAMRPESRDRIRAIVRREYRSRRKSRLRAGRAAARATPAGRVQAQAWLGSSGGAGRDRT